MLNQIAAATAKNMAEHTTVAGPPSLSSSGISPGKRSRPLPMPCVRLAEQKPPLRPEAAQPTVFASTRTTSSSGYRSRASSAVHRPVNPPPTTPYQGLDHFGLRVNGIDAIVAELKAKGVEFTREPTTVRPGVRVAFLRAPEGVSIELLDRNAT